jgi:hypothetical protein
VDDGQQELNLTEDAMKLGVVLLVGMFGAPAFAAVINGSFEQGLDGWTKTGGGLTYYTTGADGELDLDNPVAYPFDPTTNPWYDGSWKLAPGGVDGAQHLLIEHYGVPTDLWDFEAPDGTTYWFYPGDDPLWVGLYQDVMLSAGETLSGWAAFDTDELLPDYRDFARVTVNGEVVWHRHLSDVLVYDEELEFWIVPEVTWAPWSFLATAPGLYRLQFELHTDDQEYSSGLFDGVRVTGAAGVPDAGSTVVLLGLALAMLRAAARRAW